MASVFVSSPRFVCFPAAGKVNAIQPRWEGRRGTSTLIRILPALQLALSRALSSMEFLRRSSKDFVRHWEDRLEVSATGSYGQAGCLSARSSHSLRSVLERDPFLSLVSFSSRTTQVIWRCARGD